MSRKYSKDQGGVHVGFELGCNQPLHQTASRCRKKTRQEGKGTEQANDRQLWGHEYQHELSTKKCGLRWSVSISPGRAPPTRTCSCFLCENGEVLRRPRKCKRAEPALAQDWLTSFGIAWYKSINFEQTRARMPQTLQYETFRDRILQPQSLLSSQGDNCNRISRQFSWQGVLRWQHLLSKGTSLWQLIASCRKRNAKPLKRTWTQDVRVGRNSLREPLLRSAWFPQRTAKGGTKLKGGETYH